MHNLTRDDIRNIKSTLTNQIFKQEMLHMYEQKMEQLAGHLETVKGKKSYSYLPKSV